MKITKTPSRARLTYTVFAKPRGCDDYRRVATADSERLAIRIAGMVLADGDSECTQVWVRWGDLRQRRCAKCISASACTQS